MSGVKGQPVKRGKLTPKGAALKKVELLSSIEDAWMLLKQQKK